MSSPRSISIPASELPIGAMRAITVADTELVVCRTKDGIFALDNVCTHAWARMSEGRLRGDRLICPLHGASFDIRSGRVLGAPATKPLATHRAQLVGEFIEISLHTPI